MKSDDDSNVPNNHNLSGDSSMRGADGNRISMVMETEEDEEDIELDAGEIEEEGLDRMEKRGFDRKYLIQ